MSYGIDYSTMPDGPAKNAKAIKDIQTYMGKREFTKAHEILMSEHRTKGLDYKTLSFNAQMFIGIAGFPLFAWHGKILAETTWNRKETDEHHGNLVKLIRDKTPKCLHLGDAPERFLRDMADADEDFSYTLTDFVMLFLSLWDEVYGSNEPAPE